MYPAVWSVRFLENAPSGVAFPSAVAAAGAEEAAVDVVIAVDMMTVDVHRGQIAAVVNLQKMVVGAVQPHDAVLVRDDVAAPAGKSRDAVLANHWHVVAQARSGLGVRRKVQSRLSAVGASVDHPLASEDDDVDGDVKVDVKHL